MFYFRHGVQFFTAYIDYSRLISYAVIYAVTQALFLLV